MRSVHEAQATVERPPKFCSFRFRVLCVTIVPGAIRHDVVEIERRDQLFTSVQRPIAQLGLSPSSSHSIAGQKRFWAFLFSCWRLDAASRRRSQWCHLCWRSSERIAKNFVACAASSICGIRQPELGLEMRVLLLQVIRFEVRPLHAFASGKRQQFGGHGARAGLIGVASGDPIGGTFSRSSCEIRCPGPFCPAGETFPPKAPLRSPTSAVALVSPHAPPLHRSLQRRNVAVK